MKKAVFVLLSAIAVLPLFAQERTLRLDYTFSGTATEASIALDEVRSLNGWAGRRNHLDSLLLAGNGQIVIRAEDSTVLYRNSFSTLFQEWQNTEEATRVRRSFQNVFLAPMPDGPAEVTVSLFDSHGRTTATLTHPVNPSDILIRPVKAAPTVRDIRIGGSVHDCIDIVIVAEGYTAAEMDTFYTHAQQAVKAILSHEPFKSYADRFNFRALGLESADSGVSVPHEGLWLDTPLHSGFDTFYTPRYLTTLHIKDLWDAIGEVPCEHIIILANTTTYGGGGIFNSYLLTTARHLNFKPVVVHEFGHSFAGLADEYFYDDQYTDYYYPDFEPWEPNITTKADFSKKWEDMMDKCGVGLHEGGGYMSKGVWRSSHNCRMRTNEARGFCPVCRRAIERMIRFYTD